jgi:hypothetical protein
VSFENNGRLFFLYIIHGEKVNFINLQKAVVEIRQACAGVKDNQRTPFFFIVGAGVSSPSIPIASELVKELKDSAREYGHQDEPPGKAPVDAYAHWFQAAYPQRIDRQRFLRSLIEKKPITHANLRLAHLLLERTLTNLVVTPNFDDFLTRSLQLFGKYHVICDHPKTVERIDHEQGDVPRARNLLFLRLLQPERRDRRPGQTVGGVLHGLLAGSGHVSAVASGRRV